MTSRGVPHIVFAVSTAVEMPRVKLLAPSRTTRRDGEIRLFSWIVVPRMVLATEAASKTTLPTVPLEHLIA